MGTESGLQHPHQDRFNLRPEFWQKCGKQAGLLSVLSVLSEGYTEKNVLLSVLSERPMKKHYKTFVGYVGTVIEGIYGEYSPIYG